MIYIYTSTREFLICHIINYLKKPTRLVQLQRFHIEQLGYVTQQKVSPLKQSKLKLFVGALRFNGLWLPMKFIADVQKRHKKTEVSPKPKRLSE